MHLIASVCLSVLLFALSQLNRLTYIAWPLPADYNPIHFCRFVRVSVIRGHCRKSRIIVNICFSKIKIWLVFWDFSAPPLKNSHSHDGACPTNGGSVIHGERVGTIQSFSSQTLLIVVHVHIIISDLHTQHACSDLIVGNVVGENGCWKPGTFTLRGYPHQSQIGWIFKSKANKSYMYCLYCSEPMVRHYALKYGFRTFPNLLKNLKQIREHMEAILKCIVSDDWS